MTTMNSPERHHDERQRQEIQQRPDEGIQQREDQHGGHGTEGVRFDAGTMVTARNTARPMMSTRVTSGRSPSPPGPPSRLCES